MTIGLGKVGLWRPERAWDLDDSAHRDAVRELDELGYGALWLGNAAGDLGVLARFLELSTRIVLATGIVNVWTHDAADVAAAYHDVDKAHPGRVLIGLGNSHAPAVEPTGQSYTKPYSKLRSYLDEVDQADPPLPQQARVLAALGPRTVALARDRAAGAHPYLTTPEHTARAREILGDGPLLAPEQKVVLETDRARAREIARKGAAVYLRLPNYVNNLRRLGFTDEDVAEGGSDRLIDALVACGDVDAVWRRVREHLDAGADHVCVQVLTDSDDLPRTQWRELAPAVREA